MSDQAQASGVQKFLQDKLQNIGDAFGAADDAYMGAARKHLLQLPEEGIATEGVAPGFRNNAGRYFFQARQGATGVNPDFQFENIKGQPQWMGKTGMFMNRAAHAGLWTAAGVGLATLTHAVASQFGGPGDEPTDSQLYM
jgi:hypothetical protein